MRKAVSSAGKFFGFNTVSGKDGRPYLTRVWFWRLRLHVFHRADADPDPHDHPWDFWTFPLTPYVEEVVTPELRPIHQPPYGGEPVFDLTRETRVVKAFRWHFRPAEHLHRVLGRYTGHAYFGESSSAPILWDISPDHVNSDARLRPYFDPTNRKIVTLVWFGKPRRKWGFVTRQGKRAVWIPWRKYVFGEED